MNLSLNDLNLNHRVILMVTVAEWLMMMMVSSVFLPIKSELFRFLVLQPKSPTIYLTHLSLSFPTQFLSLLVLLILLSY